MNRVHDMGGRPCHEPIHRTEGEDHVFEHEWHARALAVTLAAGMLGKWNLDASRHARECLAEDDYRNLSYYEVWMAALSNLLVNSGLVRKSELSDPGSAEDLPVGASSARADQVAEVLKGGSPTEREIAAARKFRVGQSVRACSPHRNRFVDGGHTRLPSYVRGRIGRICHTRQAHVLPDSNAHFLGERPEYVYSVQFPMSELWKSGAEHGVDEVILDLWESYLEPA